MPRAPYSFVQAAGVTQPIFHDTNLGQRLVALADGAGICLEDRSGPPGLDCLRVTAVPRAGAPRPLGQVLRPNTPDLRHRVALAIALAESDRAQRRMVG